MNTIFMLRWLASGVMIKKCTDRWHHFLLRMTEWTLYNKCEFNCVLFFKWRSMCSWAQLYHTGKGCCKLMGLSKWA